MTESKKLRRILIVNGNVRLSENLAQLIVMAFPGIDIVQAISAEAALTLMGSQTVDLVLSDVPLPDVNGYQFARMIRNDFPGTRIILLTHFNFPDDAETASAATALLIATKKDYTVSSVSALLNAIVEQRLSDSPVLHITHGSGGKKCAKGQRPATDTRS